MQITTEQAVDLAQEAGFTGEALVTIVAIAHAESALNTECEGDVTLEDNTWGPSVGLTQIRSLKAEEGKGTTRDRLANYDGLTNFVHAKVISSDGTNFNPWSTFTNGAYKQFMDEVKAVVDGKIQKPIETPTQPVNEQPRYHTVIANDTLSEIALKYNTTVDALMKINPQIVNANQIWIGETVRVK